MLEERFNNDVYIRAPRGWMKELAKNLNCSYTKKSKTMFKNERILSFQGFFLLFSVYIKKPHSLQLNGLSIIPLFVRIQRNQTL